MSSGYIFAAVAVLVVVGVIVGAYVYFSSRAQATAISQPDAPTQPSGGVTQDGDQQDINS